MSKAKFNAAVETIIQRDSTYDKEAYLFLRESLEHTVQTTRADELIEHRHVSAKELLDGLRDFAIKEFGPMSLAVLEAWGVTCGKDVGKIVYNLIEEGVFGRSEYDHPKDFENWQDFELAFQKPFRATRPVLAGFDLSGNRNNSTSQPTARSNQN